MENLNLSHKISMEAKSMGSGVRQDCAKTSGHPFTASLN